MCTGWPTTAMPKPSCLSERAFSRSGGDVVTCFDVVGCRERWSNAVGCEVTWGEVMWLVARCHVMSCDVIWCVFILCDAISCVVWCHVMHCDVMWCPLMWWAVIYCEVMRCNGMRSYEFVMHCGWLRCHVVWFEMVVWGELEDDLVIRTTQIYSVLHSTTKYYSGTTQYYSSTILCTTKYHTHTRTGDHSSFCCCCRNILFVGLG